jgi:hypothetical protein
VAGAARVQQHVEVAVVERYVEARQDAAQLGARDAPVAVAVDTRARATNGVAIRGNGVRHAAQRLTAGVLRAATKLKRGMRHRLRVCRCIARRSGAASRRACRRRRVGVRQRGDSRSVRVERLLAGVGCVERSRVDGALRRRPGRVLSRARVLRALKHALDGVQGDQPRAARVDQVHDCRKLVVAERHAGRQEAVAQLMRLQRTPARVGEALEQLNDNEGAHASARMSRARPPAAAPWGGSRT